ncbi:hypothetical protein M422DRAFT_782663 [Sphaerobolus stellatus SS14]|uniref:Uncharacterized protein n=1 Tax=Sphaerobolus stellatus (strain SS14) TaxID=990650 RepID=A0A0C9VCA9_SPHS4|nr:hypothetical protein M422DRAFT_782663 [Sphaerobolus stellatus SS14]
MSFDRMFHNVDLALRLAIAKHEFRPEQIWKLDSLAKERSKSKSFELDDDGSWTKKEKAATSKDYPTQRSLFDPLTRYFQMVQLYILYSAGINSAGQVIFALGEYLRQLQNLAAEYEWNAVLRYHFEFHSIRLAEMRSGDYSGWAVFDRNLGGQYLDGHMRRSNASKTNTSTTSSTRTQFCFAFQAGNCSSPCAHGRLHQCQHCKSDAHGSKNCSQKKAPVA